MTRVYSAFNLRWIRGSLAWTLTLDRGVGTELRFCELERVEYVWKNGEKEYTRFTRNDAPASFHPDEADELVESLNGQARRKYYRAIARKERRRIRSETHRDPEEEDRLRRYFDREVRRMTADLLGKPMGKVGRRDVTRFHRAHEQP